MDRIRAENHYSFDVIKGQCFRKDGCGNIVPYYDWTLW